MGLVGVNTLWIDSNGNGADPFRVIGRVGKDVRVFALHSLGWIRVEELSQFWKIEFDPGVVTDAARKALIALIRRLSAEGRLWVVQLSVYTGRSWLDWCEYDVTRLIAWIEGVAELRAENPVVPSAIQAVDLGIADPDRYRDPILEAVADAWRFGEQRVGMSPADPFVRMPWGALPGRNVKVLLRDPVDRAIVFGTYFPARTSLWTEPTVERFSRARVVDQVPDRSLAAKVVESAETTLSRNQPRSERLTGLCRRSDGNVVHMDWLRVSFPAYLGNADTPNAVIVFCKTLAIQDLR